MVLLPSDEDIQKLKDQKDWVGELKTLSELIEKIHRLGKSTSIRSLSQATNKSKSWIGVSLLLLKGLKLYPEIEKLDNRNLAFLYLQKKSRLRRFIES